MRPAASASTPMPTCAASELCISTSRFGRLSNLQSPLSTLHSPFSMTGRAQQGGCAPARRGVDADANLRRHHRHNLCVGTSSGGSQGGEIVYDMCFWPRSARRARCARASEASRPLSDDNLRQRVVHQHLVDVQMMRIRDSGAGFRASEASRPLSDADENLRRQHLKMRDSLLNL